ncbi:hypothetical protein, partial [Novosphingobium sp. KN65.2]|uniref:hypothetical protein n=1 Tax=Novosphingobium sp. KN65.2 TaxID=1478134 RepID=UPI0012E16AB8
MQYADAAIRTVLDALREPSPGMVDRFVSRALCVSIHDEGSWSNYARNQWQAMLDAAIREHAMDELIAGDADLMGVAT